MSRFPVYVALALVLSACNKDDTSGVDSDTVDPEQEPARLAMTPNVAGQGQRLEVHLDATRSAYEFGETALDLGPGVVVEQVVVEDGYNAVATVVVDPDADLGTRDATITIAGHETVLADAFEVIAQSFLIEPNSGLMGETIEVAIVGTDTQWEQGFTWPGFGDDVDILDFQVLSETLGSARIAIHPDARPGPRDVAMQEGEHVVTLYDGFQVDRQVITAFFEPPTGFQGDTIDFEIHGLDTDFAEGNTTVEFWDDAGANADIAIQSLTWLDGQELYGRMRLSNAARLGMRDIVISYGTGDTAETILVPDGFEVLDAPPDLSNVAVGLRFDVERAIDNTNGDLLENVIGMAYFIIPLSPPCGSPPPPGDGPQPYDQNGVWPVPPPAEPEDCPNPETVSAGPQVWFVGPENTVTLDKDVIPATGQIIYWGNDLTLADYHFNTMYDLEAPGDVESGMPPFYLVDVQPTVPADYYLTAPDFWNDLTISRGEDFPYSWTPAQTYPDAIFGTSINGILASNGEPGFAGSLPWDDGEHVYTAAELSQLEASPVSFSAYSYIEGPYFGLPFSSIQTCKSDSTLSTGAQLILE